MRKPLIPLIPLLTRSLGLILFAAILGRGVVAVGEDAPAPPKGDLPFEPLKHSIDVGLVVADEAKAAEFYGDVLGLKPSPPITLPDGGKMLRYQIGSTSVKLLVLPGDRPKYVGGIQKGIGLRLLTMYFKDLDAVAESFAAHGLQKPQIMGQGGGRLIFAFDPDGNQLELIEVANKEEPGAVDRTMVGITVADVEKSREFYGKVLGLPELDPIPLFGKSGPTKYQFKLGKTGVKFWKFEGKDLPNMAGKYDAAMGIRYITFLVKDVEAAHEAIKARGGKIAQEPMDVGKLARVMFLADPDGNWIEIAAPQRPKPKP